MILFLAAAFWAGPPAGHVWLDGAGQAAWADQGGSNSGPGSANSGPGSSGDDDDDDDNSGPGGGSSGPGHSGKGKPGAAAVAVGKTRLPVFGGDGIHVRFSDGSTERVRAGIFERIDKRGRVVERHGASGQDIGRLRSMEAKLGAEGRASGIVTFAEIDERSGRVEITDFRGWRETLTRARYELSDPDGRAVSRRALTPEDVRRIRAFLFPG